MSIFDVMNEDEIFSKMASNATVEIKGAVLKSALSSKNKETKEKGNKTQTVPVKFKVDLEHYSPEETDTAWVHIFSKRLLDKETKVQVPLSKEVLVNLQMKPLIPSARDFLHVHIYVKRILDARTQEIHDGKEWEYARSAQPFVDRVGFETITMEEAEKGSERPLLDILQNVVGHFKLQPIGRAKGGYVVNVGSELPAKRFSMNDQPMPELTSLVASELKRIHSNWKESNLTPTLRRFQFAMRPQPCGQMPICAFPLLRLVTPTTQREIEDNTNYLIHSQRVAKFLLNLDNPANPVQWAALLNEMNVLPTVAALYVTDVTRVGKTTNEVVDDWASPGDSPEPGLIAQDCENAAEQILQEDHCIRSDAQFKKTKLGQFIAGYFSFLVGMTLYLPSKKQWVYHAATMKLDRNYVLYHLSKKKKTATNENDKKDEFQPSILGEGTCYSTGPWGYKYTEKEETVLAASRLLFSGGCETITKFTPSVIRSKGIYGHVQSLFSPQLFEEFKICQIELGYRGKLGVPAEMLMECSLHPEIEFRPIIIPEQRFETIKKEIDTFREYYPRTPLPRAPEEPFRPPIDAKDRVACFFVRAQDYKGESTLQELERAAGLELNAFPIQIRRGLSIEFVYALPDKQPES
jgi:hypothetical protein